VLRAFDAAHRTLTLAELAGLTGMSKASAQRTVHTLQVLGYVGKHPQTRRFQLLPKVIELGFNYIAAHPLIRTAHPTCRSWPMPAARRPA
jgi:DNA-binding IclR family transcriptional regulator